MAAHIRTKSRPGATLLSTMFPDPLEYCSRLLRLGYIHPGWWTAYKSSPPKETYPYYQPPTLRLPVDPYIRKVFQKIPMLRKEKYEPLNPDFQPLGVKIALTWLRLIQDEGMEEDAALHKIEQDIYKEELYYFAKTIRDNPGNYIKLMSEEVKHFYVHDVLNEVAYLQGRVAAGHPLSVVAAIHAEEGSNVKLATESATERGIEIKPYDYTFGDYGRDGYITYSHNKPIFGWGGRQDNDALMARAPVGGNYETQRWVKTGVQVPAQELLRSIASVDPAYDLTDLETMGVRNGDFNWSADMLDLTLDDYLSSETPDSLNSVAALEEGDLKSDLMKRFWDVKKRVDSYNKLLDKMTPEERKAHEAFAKYVDAVARHFNSLFPNGNVVNDQFLHSSPEVLERLQKYLLKTQNAIAFYKRRIKDIDFKLKSYDLAYQEALNDESMKKDIKTSLIAEVRNMMEELAAQKTHFEAELVSSNATLEKINELFNKQDITEENSLTKSFNEMRQTPLEPFEEMQDPILQYINRYYEEVAKHQKPQPLVSESESEVESLFDNDSDSDFFNSDLSSSESELSSFNSELSASELSASELSASELSSTGSELFISESEFSDSEVSQLEEPETDLDVLDVDAALDKISSSAPSDLRDPLQLIVNDLPLLQPLFKKYFAPLPQKKHQLSRNLVQPDSLEFALSHSNSHDSVYFKHKEIIQKIGELEALKQEDLKIMRLLENESSK